MDRPPEGVHSAEHLATLAARREAWGILKLRLVSCAPAGAVKASAPKTVAGLAGGRSCSQLPQPPSLPERTSVEHASSTWLARRPSVRLLRRTQAPLGYQQTAAAWPCCCPEVCGRHGGGGRPATSGICSQRLMHYASRQPPPTPICHGDRASSSGTSASSHLQPVAGVVHDIQLAIPQQEGGV